MIQLLGFLFIIVIAVLLIGLSFIVMFVRGIFNLGKRAPRRTAASVSQPAGNSARSVGEDTRANRKKIFDKDEGEYVEFEEIN